MLMKVRKELIVSVFATLFSVGAYIYGFVLADRTGIFLYEHLGAGPFDWLTTGRYWMFGFVVAGFVSLTCFVTMLFLKLSGKKIVLDWKIIAKHTIVLLFTSSIIITRLGQPPLPYPLAISTAFTLTFAILIGISFVNDLIINWLPTVRHAMVAVGFIPFVILFRVLELPNSGLTSVKTAVVIVVLIYLLAIVWMTVYKWIFRNQEIKEIILLKAIVVMVYLVLPVLHFLMTVFENHPYISSSDNFFANNLLLRISNWLILVLTVFGINSIKFKRKSSLSS